MTKREDPYMLSDEVGKLIRDNYDVKSVEVDMGFLEAVYECCENYIAVWDIEYEYSGIIEKYKERYGDEIYEAIKSELRCCF